MISGSLVTMARHGKARHGTARHVLGLQVEETTSRYGGRLRIYWISSCGQPTIGGPRVWEFDVGLRAATVENNLRNITQGLGRRKGQGSEESSCIKDRWSNRRLEKDKEYLRNLYSSPNKRIIKVINWRRIRWTGHVEMRKACRILVWEPEGKKPLGRPRRRWADNIKIELREIRRDDVDWINLAHDTDQWKVLVNMEMNLRVP
jgi:hypothetical protein